MYVCICQEVTDRQIRQAVEEGASTMRHLRKDLGVAACCGRCAPHAKALLDEARQENRAVSLSAACA